MDESLAEQFICKCALTVHEISRALYLAESGHMADRLMHKCQAKFEISKVH